MNIFGGTNLSKLVFFQCEPTTPIPGDIIDNDCDKGIGKPNFFSTCLTFSPILKPTLHLAKAFVGTKKVIRKTIREEYIKSKIFFTKIPINFVQQLKILKVQLNQFCCQYKLHNCIRGMPSHQFFHLTHLF